MILISDLQDFTPADHEGPLGYHTAAMKYAFASAVEDADRQLKENGLLDVVITLRGLIVAVVRRGLEEETKVTNFEAVARM